jgi:hypothetical protein
VLVTVFRDSPPPWLTAFIGALDRLRDLGAEKAFDYHTTVPRDLGRFDVILDPVARDMRPYRRLLAQGGTARLPARQPPAAWSFPQMRVMAAMSSSSSGSVKYFWTDSSKVRPTSAV